MAEAAGGLIESCLGSGTDVISPSDDVEVLHALVLRHAAVFESLAATAEKVTGRSTGMGGLRQVRGQLQWVSCCNIVGDRCVLLFS